MRTRGPILVEEQSGDRFPDLETVQRQALLPLAVDLAAALRQLIASGALVQQGGRVLPGDEDSEYA